MQHSSKAPPTRKLAQIESLPVLSNCVVRVAVVMLVILTAGLLWWLYSTPGCCGNAGYTQRRVAVVSWLHMSVD